MKKSTRVLVFTLILFGVGYTLIWFNSKIRSAPISDADIDSTGSPEARSRPLEGRSESHKVTLESPSVTQASVNLDSLDLEKAHALLNQYQLEVTDVISHAEFAAELVVKLCKDGRTDEAWSFIATNRGQMRAMQLREFFKNADLSRAELVSKLSGFGFPMDLKRGLEGYLLRLSPSKYAEELSSPEIREFGEVLGMSPDESLNWAMNSLMADLFGRRNSDQNPPDESTIRDLVDSIKEMDTKGELKASEVQQIVLQSELGIFDQWEILKDHLNAPEGVDDSLRKRVVGTLLVSNPDKAMNTILSAPGLGTSDNLGLAIREWIGVDSNGPSNWYAKNRTNLNSQQQDLMTSAFSNTALKFSEFDTARQWADQIQDPQQKEAILSAIAEKQAGRLPPE